MKAGARRLLALENGSLLGAGLVGVAVAGYLLRVVVWLCSEGSNDIRTWNLFAESVVEHGLARTYVLNSYFNHPPLMGLWGAAALKLSELSAVSFDRVFKLPSLIAELATGYLLYGAWRRRGEPLTALRALALYAASLCAILISAYHGNTDAIYFCFAFLAADLLERRSPFWSGFALGAAVNVKLIPVLIGLPLASRCRDRRELIRFVLGGLCAMTPFAVLLLVMSSAERRAFIQNVFLYRSLLEPWGAELVARVFVVASEKSVPALSLWIREAADSYSLSSGSILLVISAGIAAWQLWFARRKLDAYALTTLGFASFLMFGGGFGVQYLGCVIAPLLACTLTHGALVSAILGVTAFFIYFYFVVQWSPVYSEHYFIPPEFGALSVLCWLALASAALHLLRQTLPVVWPNEFLTPRAKRILRIAVPLVLLAVVGVFASLRVSAWVEARHDLAAGKPWRASSEWARCDPEQERCGNTSGTRIFFHTNEEQSPWVEFDLGKETAFSKVKVRNRTDCCEERAVPLALEISHDREKWTQIARKKNPFRSWTADVGHKRARYVRARLLGTAFFHLESVMVLE
jgi:hypothetical protein